jgi:ABC-type lipoprotein export system ATPase subunit
MPDAMPDVSTEAAVCQNVRRVFRSASGPVDALRGVSASFARGQVTAVVGPSGSGKSTLLRILAALDRPTEGMVVVDGRDLAGLGRAERRRLRRNRVGFLFPSPADNLLPYLDALEHVRLAARLRNAEDADAAPLLDALGLGHRLDHRPAQLSGGEQQRLALAAAVVGDPALVLADEPTAQLDRASAQVLVGSLAGLAARGGALVVATHDPVVADAADVVIRIADGEVVG